MEARDRRLKVSQMLHNIFDKPKQIYYSPPANKDIVYPAIIYTRAKTTTIKADNKKYLMYDRYNVTFIHKESDDPTYDKLCNLPYCEHDRQMRIDDLYHDYFTLYVK